MIKVKPDGSLEIGEEWELTEADLEEIACIISNTSEIPSMKKLGGRWVQECPSDIMDRGYRVFSPGEEKVYDV